MTLPFLPYEAWTDTRVTLHLVMQIIGKIRLKLTPRKNHWWYITQYVTPDGFSTHAIPMTDGLHTFKITLNVHEHAVQLTNSKGEHVDIALKDGFTISAFYKQIMNILDGWGMRPNFIEKPFDMNIDTPFAEITNYHHYDWHAITTFWHMMLWNDGIFKEFSGRFYGKTCPVHIYWHHLDLAVTRFNGKRVPDLDSNAPILEKDAYSHEVISFGFWAGDDNTPEPAYYVYAAPSPHGLGDEPLEPKQAQWINANGSPMAILTYKDILKHPDPRATLLAFLESAYQAGAKRAKWDVDSFAVPALAAL